MTRQKGNECGGTDDFMKEKKELLIHIFAQMSAFAISIGINFFLSPFLVQQLGAEAHGFLTLGNQLIQYLYILTIAVNSMAVRWITVKYYEGQKQEVNEFYTSLLYTNGILSGLLSVLAVLFIFHFGSYLRISTELLTDVTILWAFLFVNFILNLFVSMLQIAVRLKNQLVLLNLSNIVASLISAIIILLCYLCFAPKVWYVGLGTIVSTIYLFGRHYKYTKRLLPELSVKRGYFRREKICTLIKSGIWNSLNHLGMILTTGLDALMVNLLVNANAMGVVTIAKTLPTYVLLLFANLASVFTPKLTIEYAKGNLDMMKKNLRTYMKILGMLSGSIMPIMFLFGETFFSLWQPTQEARVLHLLSIACCLEYPLVLALEPLWNIFTILDKVKQSSLAVFIKGLAAIIATLFLLNTRNLTDLEAMLVICGVSSLFNILMTLTFLAIAGAKYLGFPWYTFYRIMLQNALYILGISGLLYGVRHFICPGSWGGLFAIVLGTVLISSGLYILIFLSEEEKCWIKEKILEKYASVRRKM